jgi:hypothetical protein
MHSSGGGGRKPRSSAASSSVRDFQVTKRTEVVGSDKQFNDIRAMMNKLSLKTLESQKPIILDAISNFLFNQENDENRRMKT